MKAKQHIANDARCPCYQKHGDCRIFCHCDQDERFIASVWFHTAQERKHFMKGNCRSMSGYKECPMYKVWEAGN